MTDSRLHHAVVAAQEQFWASIARSFPEIKSGDFAPDAATAFDGACLTAAATWVHGNQDGINGDPRMSVLEDLGYEVLADSDQPGLWVWIAPTDGCESSFNSAKEALAAAWADAAGQTMGIQNLSSEQWDALSQAQQSRLMRETLSGD